MIKITDKSFRYTPSFNTDLRKRFRKVQAELKASEEMAAAQAETLRMEDERNAQEAAAKVAPLKRSAK